MLDKEKVITEFMNLFDLLDFHENFESNYEFSADIKYFFSQIKRGDFDIPPKPQETCEWDINRWSSGGGFVSTQCSNKRYERSLQSIQEYKHCPYCGKPIEEVKDE